MKLTLAELTALAAKHGFPDPALAAAIAMVESAEVKRARRATQTSVRAVTYVIGQTARAVALGCGR